MSDHVAIEELQRVVDEIYRSRDRATRRDVYSAASARLHLSSDELALLNELPEGVYSRGEMMDAINSAVERRGGHRRPSA